MKRSESPREKSAVNEKPNASSQCSNGNAGSQRSPDKGSVKGPQQNIETSQTDGNQSHRFPPAHVVLYQPEIPQNTGNIGRTCVATQSKLWIVRPAGFQLDEKRIRRSGLDYWQHLDLTEADHWEDLTQQLADQHQRQRFFYLSRFAEREIWDAEFQRGDVFVFGSESNGLPEQILQTDAPHALRLPTSDKVRSLNLATTVGIVLFEYQRQIRNSAGG